MLLKKAKRDNSALINDYLFRTIEQWMPGLKKNSDGSYNCINPERNDSDPGSMRVYSDGHAYDFSAKKRYSMIDLKAYVSHDDPKRVFKEVGLQLGVLAPRHGGSVAARPYSAQAIPIPIKKDSILAKRPEPNIPLIAATDHEIHRGKKIDDTFLTPTAVWAYKNKGGVIIAYAQRFDYLDTEGEKKKEFRPLTWSNDNRAWVYNKSGLNGFNPIYGAELLDSNPTAKVLIVEGEKTADAARLLFPEMIVVTFYGGTSSADKCDWSILQGREVLLWPDADQKTDANGTLLPAFEQSSMKAMISVARMLEGVARSSLIVSPPAGVRNKWDLADVNETQLTAADLRERMESAAHHFSHYLPAVIEAAPAEVVQFPPTAAPLIRKWRPEQITTGLRTAFLEAVSMGTYGDEFPFAKGLYYYEPMPEANSKRRVPHFIAHVAEDGQVSICPEAKWIDQFIQWYDRDGMHSYGSTPLLENVLVTLAKRLVPRLPRLPEPALFKLRGQTGNAWNILNLDISKDHLAPSGIDFDGSEANAMEILEKIAPPWFEQLSRMNNRLAFMCYLGAIIDPQAHPQQYLWLYGKGNDGKSTIIQVLQALFGPAAMKSEWPDNPNNFYTSRMESRRLLLLDDQEHGKVVRSGLWKTITGSDTITIEHKGQSPYVVPNELLLVSASNSRPEGSADRADTRRLVLCECTTFPRDKVVKDYYKTLLQYSDPFFSLCWQLWNAHKGSKGFVPVDHEVTRHNTLEAYAAEEDFVAANFATFDLEQIAAGFEAGCAKKQIPHTKNEDLRKLAEKARVSFKRVVEYLVNVCGFPAQLISYAKDEKHRVIFGVVPKPEARAFAGVSEQEFAPLPAPTKPESITAASKKDAKEVALVVSDLADPTHKPRLEETRMALIETNASHLPAKPPLRRSINSLCAASARFK